MPVMFQAAARVRETGTRRVGTLYLTERDLIFVNLGTEVRYNDNPILRGGPTGAVFLFFLPLVQLVNWLGRSRTLRSAQADLDEIEAKPGAMSPEEQYAACPGSFLIPLDKLARRRITWWGSLRLQTTLDDVYTVRLGGREGDLDRLLPGA